MGGSKPHLSLLTSSTCMGVSHPCRYVSGWDTVCLDQLWRTERLLPPGAVGAVLSTYPAGEGGAAVGGAGSSGRASGQHVSCAGRAVWGHSGEHCGGRRRQGKWGRMCRAGRLQGSGGGERTGQCKVGPCADQAGGVQAACLPRPRLNHDRPKHHPHQVC